MRTPQEFDGFEALLDYYVRNRYALRSHGGLAMEDQMEAVGGWEPARRAPPTSKAARRGSGVCRP